MCILLSVNGFAEDELNNKDMKNLFNHFAVLCAALVLAGCEAGYMMDGIY